MTDLERKRLEKEIQGLTAKLEWDYVDESLKENWRQRIFELQAKIKAEG